MSKFLLQSRSGSGYCQCGGFIRLVFLLGFILGFSETIVIVAPIINRMPAMAINAIGLDIMLAINLQTLFLTPQFGFALLYIRGVAPAALAISDLYRGVLPCIIIQSLAIGLSSLWTAPATWLPAQP